MNRSRNALKNIGRTPESKSKYMKQYAAVSGNDRERVVQMLMDQFASREEKAVLFPVDDIGAEAIDNSLELLEPYFFLPNINHAQGAVAAMMDKAVQKARARMAGLDVVEGWTIPIAQGRYEIPEDLRYPCFVKAEVPLWGRKKLMKKCSDEGELREQMDAIASERDCVMLAEEFIEVEKEYCIVGLCNREKVFIPDIIDETVMGHGAHAGVTCFGKVLDPGAPFFADFLSKLRTFLSELNFQGLFTVDVFQSGDRLIFCELNLRVGGSGVAIIGAGVNIAAMMASILQGREDVDYQAVCREITFASERPLMNDYGMNYISWAEYKRYISQADFRFIYSEEDKRPYWNYSFNVVKEMVRKRVRG